MRAWFVAAALCIAACGGKKAAPPERLQPGDIALVGATVVPMDREGTVADQTVVVRKDQIVLVAPSAGVDTTGATVIDARGKWIVPGLADMHVHTWSERDFDMYLLNGVTTVRDMFGSARHLAWRTQISEGKLAGPTLITTGPIVDGDPPTWPGSAVVKTAEDAKRVVREQKQAGYDLVKVYSSLSVEAYEAIVTEAKAQGIWFGGHVPKAVGLDRVLASGQRTIEHLDGYVPFNGEPRVGKDIVDATVKSGAWNCPTLVVVERFGRLDDLPSLDKTPGLELVSPAVRAQWDPKNDFRLKSWTPERFAQQRARNQLGRTLVSDLQKAGAKLVLGTDTGNPFVVPGFAVHDELALLVGSGLTPWQALRMATAAPAELLEQPGKFGVVAAGARADLLVVDGDPLASIGALAKPSIVVVRGKVHKRDELLAAATKKPTDALAALPKLEVEGEELAQAGYEVAMNGAVIGRERARLSKLVDGTRVIRGQAVYDVPSAVYQYRATPDRVEYADGLVVTRKDGTVTAKPATGAAVELATMSDAVLAPQTVAEFIWYGQRLAGAAVGSTTAITAAEIVIESAITLDLGKFTFKRLPDADGRRVFEMAGTHGKLDLKGKFSIDADGAPHQIEVTVIWGTFITRRVE